MSDNVIIDALSGRKQLNLDLSSIPPVRLCKFLPFNWHNWYSALLRVDPASQPASRPPTQQQQQPLCHLVVQYAKVFPFVSDKSTLIYIYIAINYAQYLG